MTVVPAVPLVSLVPCWCLCEVLCMVTVVPVVPLHGVLGAYWCLCEVLW